MGNDKKENFKFISKHKFHLRELPSAMYAYQIVYILAKKKFSSMIKFNR